MGNYSAIRMNIGGNISIMAAYDVPPSCPLSLTANQTSTHRRKRNCGIQYNIPRHSGTVLPTVPLVIGRQTALWAVEPAEPRNHGEESNLEPADLVRHSWTKK